MGQKPKSKAPRTARRTEVGRKIVGALTELRDALRDGGPLEARFTVRTVELPDPGRYDAAGVKRTRERVNASQAVFARMLGVSAVLVRSWEHGDRTPAPWARRLLDEVNRDPHRWAGMIRQTTATPPTEATRRQGQSRRDTPRVAQPPHKGRRDLAPSKSSTVARRPRAATV